MTYVVTENCDNCKYTDCVEVCPADAFREGENMLYIDPDDCVDCDACVPECPVEAIFPDTDVPEKWQHYIEINQQEAPKFPLITEKQDPLPTAKTLKEINGK